MRLLLRAVHGIGIAPVQGPETPADRLARRRRDLTQARIRQIIEDD